VSNLLIVESENDKYFFEALIEYIKVDIKVDPPILSVDEYECLGGISKLKNKLESIKSQVDKGHVDKLGIIFDADKVGIESRKQTINEEFDSVFGSEHDLGIEVHILNIDGYGELETLLRQIKSKPSENSDCLDAWRLCRSRKNLPEISDKDFDKLWVSFYHRYDSCSNQEKKQAARKCSNEASFKKPIYDFNMEQQELTELKEFLLQFSSK